MKLYLPLALFLLAVSTAAQTSSGLLSSSTAWSVTSVSFNPYLGHEYEGCWPNGTIALSSNQSGSFFTASEWTGPGCEDYDVSGGETFYIGNGSQYGYLDSNDSVQFNYNVINSSTILLNLWYGCDGDQSCDTTADMILSIVNPCILSSDEYTFNICSLSSLSFNGTMGPWNYSLSLLENNVISCDGSQNVWGTFTDGYGCNDIATQQPNYTVQNSNVGISFPVQQLSNSSKSFQLYISLMCSSDADAANVTTFYQTSIDSNSNLTTLTIYGSSPSACPQSIGCSAVAVGYDYYNLCLLQQSNMTFFNLSDNLFGQFSFNLGNTPLIPNCPGNDESYVFATYTTPDGCFTLANNALTYSNGDDGLQVAFSEVSTPDFSTTLQINLACNASQVSAAEFTSGLHTGGDYYGSSLSLYSTLEGTSPSACPITPNNTATLTV